MSLHPLEIKIDNEVAEALKRANVTYLFGIWILKLSCFLCS